MCGRTETRWFTQDTIYMGPHYHHNQGKAISPGFYYFPGRTTAHRRTLKIDVWQKPGDSLRIPFILVHTTTTSKEKQFLWDSITSPAEHILLLENPTRKIPGIKRSSSTKSTLLKFQQCVNLFNNTISSSKYTIHHIILESIKNWLLLLGLTGKISKIGRHDNLEIFM